ncbi:MAG: hypothetical protein ACRCSO_00585 [Sphingomonas sp.]
MTEQPDPARARYYIMALAWLGGAVIAVIGIILAARATGDGQHWVGVAVTLLGLVDMAIMPRLLAQRWRTPPQP